MLLQPKTTSITWIELGDGGMPGLVAIEPAWRRRPAREVCVTASVMPPTVEMTTGMVFREARDRVLLLEHELRSRHSWGLALVTIFGGALRFVYYATHRQREDISEAFEAAFPEPPYVVEIDGFMDPGASQFSALTGTLESDVPGLWGAVFQSIGAVRTRTQDTDLAVYLSCAIDEAAEDFQDWVTHRFKDAEVTESTEELLTGAPRLNIEVRLGGIPVEEDVVAAIIYSVQRQARFLGYEYHGWELGPLGT